MQPNYFVPIATVPEDARYHDVLRPQLYPVPGVFFRRGQGVTGTSDLLGPAMIGAVGEITAERLKQLGAPYMAGDQVGLSGLQETFERRLAGTPSATVVVATKNDDVRTVKAFPGRPAQNVRLTIDPRTQQAAEGALAGVPGNAALVAIDPATGSSARSSRSPTTASTARSAAPIRPARRSRSSRRPRCSPRAERRRRPRRVPPTVTVDGRTFHNFEGEASGALDLAQAFQISCNNAFIGLGDQLPTTALTKAATRSGSTPSGRCRSRRSAVRTRRPKTAPSSPRRRSARAACSPVPLQMASVAAAVASGHWRAPTLTEQPAASSPTVPALSASVLATLRSFMASVVTGNGTAAGAGLPPGTFGKTGTAEFGNDNPPKTHAWFIGYRGNIAFAVIVEDGGVGGRVAAPIAAKFLNLLAG